MATLALAAVGAAVGSTLLPAGVTMLGATLSGAAIGSQIGAMAGSYVDQMLLGASGTGQTVHGPRMTDLHVTASTEGAPVPRVYGRARLGGQVIWADDIAEEVVTSSAGGGGKGLGAGGGATSVTYRYYASFAVAIAEGEIASIGRIWADGAELDLSGVTYRVHNGGATQMPDDLIAARVGADNAPAYRGIAYVVFERLALADFGNRIPQLSFEVFRDLDAFRETVRGIVLIPGSGEFVYSPTTVSRGFGAGSASAENVHTRQGGTDWSISLDQMQAALPGIANVSLVVSWFGTDLRAGVCEVRPAVDDAFKVTSPAQWTVTGLARSVATTVSSREGRPAYGGTPSDDTVVAAIRDLKERGYGVTLTPFILMDIAAGNSLPDPYGVASAQPAYPWRGRITCDPAPGVVGSVDKTAAAAAQIASFVGTAAVSHFTVNGDTVAYGGPAEWSFRRMVLHYAHLAKAAGGVDAFVIGTELRGLTTVRSSASGYPFVQALVALAADVKSVLGASTKVTYAADWSEYFGHRPTDSSGDLYFHLDPLWASAGIDAIGIDLYWPLADWRDGRGHLDYLAGARSPYEVGYLAGNVAGGEGYDWYYADANARDAQLRTPITDGTGKPWVFRYKDIKSWWSELHYDRPGGIEATSATDWVPQSKPFWFMEIGCPAVDLGANQPNVFVDPKSSENALPYYSRGRRDDMMQRQYLRALIGAFDPASDVYSVGANPISTVYGGRMVDVERVHVYAWDARPYPAFPANTQVWGDGENWRLGHWLNGRIASATLEAVVDAIMADAGFVDYDASGLLGIVPGYVVDRVMSVRDALQPLGLAYFFDAIESGGRIVLRHRAMQPAVEELSLDDLVEPRAEDALLTLTRGQETELPAAAKITYIGTGGDYRQAVAESRPLTGVSARVSQAELAIVLDEEQAGSIAETWLHETWAARERAAFVLPPSRIAVEPGDVLAILVDGVERLYRVTEVGDRGARQIEARAVDPHVYDLVAAPVRPAPSQDVQLAGQPLLYFLDLPLLTGDEPPEAGYAVARQTPWPGSIAVYASPDAAGYSLKAQIVAPAIIGSTLTDLPAGPEGRLDRATRLTVEVSGGELTSATDVQVLAGRNAAAVRNASGQWEVLQFETAELLAPNTYRLSGLLRGQAGTETAMAGVVPAGAPFVILDQSRAVVPIRIDEIGLPYHWKYGPSTRNIGDATYAAASHAFVGAGLRTLSPVHVRSDRDQAAGGDLTIRWIRRTRVGGDSWELIEVPLGEAAEAYEVDILDGAEVKRTLASNAPSVVYPLAAQIADFGGVQAAYAVRVHQMSAATGRGTGRTALV
jgi:hypothetical protein